MENHFNKNNVLFSNKNIEEREKNEFSCSNLSNSSEEKIFKISSNNEIEVKENKNEITDFLFKMKKFRGLDLNKRYGKKIAKQIAEHMMKYAFDPEDDLTPKEIDFYTNILNFKDLYIEEFNKVCRSRRGSRYDQITRTIIGILNKKYK